MVQAQMFHSPERKWINQEELNKKRKTVMQKKNVLLTVLGFSRAASSICFCLSDSEASGGGASVSLVTVCREKMFRLVHLAFAMGRVDNQHK